MSKRGQLIAMIVTLICLLGGTAIFIDVIATLYDLLTALIMLGIAVGSTCLLYYGAVKIPKARRSYQLRRQYAQDMECTRFTAITWLTQADEEWLAREHFWQMPPEVARIRAGRQWDEVWFYEGRKPAEIARLDALKEMAEKAKARFYGANLTPNQTVSEPVEGEVLYRRSDTGRRQRLSKDYEDWSDYGR